MVTHLPSHQMDRAYNRTQQLNFVGDLGDQVEVSILSTAKDKGVKGSREERAMAETSFNKYNIYPIGILKGENRHNISKENIEKELQKCPFAY